MLIEELGKSTKAKYPQYSNLSDKEVGELVVQKYPEYEKTLERIEQPTEITPATKNIATRAVDFVKNDVFGGGVVGEQSIPKEIFRSTLGSRGLAGVAQMPGKVAMLPGLAKDSASLSESIGGLADQTTKLIRAYSKTTDPAQKTRMKKLIESNLQTLKESGEVSDELYQSILTPRDTISTGINAALSAPLVASAAGAGVTGLAASTLYGTGAGTRALTREALRRVPVSVAQKVPIVPAVEKVLYAGKSVIPRAVENALLGVGFSASENIRAGNELGDNAGASAAFGAVLPVAGTAAGKVKSALPKLERKMAERVVNSLVKPLLRDMSYGKNPGKRIATEGITFNSFDEGVQKIQQRMDEIGEQMTAVIEVERPKNKTYNGYSYLEPIVSVVEKLRENPRINASIISRLDDLLRDILKERNLPDGTISRRDLSNLSFEELLQFKKDLAELAKYTGNVSDDSVYNKAIQEAAGATKNALDKVSPKMKELNERWADLLQAKKAIIYRDKVEQRQNIIPFSAKTIGGVLTGAGVVTLNPVMLAAGLAEIGLDTLLGSAAFKTRFAKWLAKSKPQSRLDLIREAPLFRPLLDRVFGQDELLDEKTIYKGLNRYRSSNNAQTAVNTSSKIKANDIDIPQSIPQAPKNVKDEASGAIAGIEQDEDGNITYNPEKGALGIAGMAGFARAKGKLAGKTDDIVSSVQKSKLALPVYRTVSQIAKPIESETMRVLRGTKNMTRSDISDPLANIRIKKDIPARDVYGNKVQIPSGEVLTPYPVKGKNQVLLQDGEAYLVDKNQFQNIKGQSVGGEAKPFAPELDTLEESVLSNPKTDHAIKENAVKPRETKYTQYQLPEGKNYKEILIKAPTKLEGGARQIAGDKLAMEKYGKTMRQLWEGGEMDKWNEISNANKRAYDVNFQSSHWDEPNVISHLRMNERTYNGKKVAFMEELQSDWAREARKGKEIPQNKNLKNWQELSVKRALKEAVDNNAEYFAWINGEQTSARYNLATKVDNVNWGKSLDNKTEKSIKIMPKGNKDLVFLNIDKNGVIKKPFESSNQPSDWAGKKLDEVLGKGLADKIMEKESGTLSGEGLKFGGEWANNLYDKQVGNIVKDLTGAKIETLDMGLPISKTKDFFELVQGNTNVKLLPNKLKVGAEINNGDSNYIITDILGDGKFKAVPKNHYESLMEYKPNEKIHYNNALYPDRKTALSGQSQTFDISNPTTVQQGIRLTPEIKAKIRGEATKLENSGKMYKPYLPKQR